MQEKLLVFIKSPTTKRLLSVLVILVTVFIFVNFLNNNPETISSLRSVSILTFVLIFFLYFIFLLSNFFITKITIEICKKKYPLRQTFLLTIYSTLVNFFGPLQSGPGFRAIYLKSKVGIKIKDYTVVTLIYYVFFGLISLAMISISAWPLPTLIICLVLFLMAYYFFLRKANQSLKNYLLIFLVTAIQILIVTAIYYTALKTVTSPSFAQTLSYTGAANLALFVSITPAAIGIRESFLYFTQSIHGIASEYIVAASLIDRSIYVIFLLVIFAYSSLSHIKNSLLK